MPDDKKVIEPVVVKPPKPVKQGFWNKLGNAIGTSIGEAADKR